MTKQDDSEPAAPERIWIEDDEVVRLARERICGAVNDGWSNMADDVAVILSELDRLRAECDEQRERAEEAESEITRAQEQVSAEFEGDCWKAMRSLLDRTGFDWPEYSDDGVNASDAHQWIVEELDRLEAERDAAWQAGAEAMKREAARSAVVTPASRSDKAVGVWHDGFTSGCLHAADRIRALPLPCQPKETSHASDRDVNAAINIARVGLDTLAEGALA